MPEPALQELKKDGRLDQAFTMLAESSETLSHRVRMFGSVKAVMELTLKETAHSPLEAGHAEQLVAGISTAKTVLSEGIDVPNNIAQSVEGLVARMDVKDQGISIFEKEVVPWKQTCVDMVTEFMSDGGDKKLKAQAEIVKKGAHKIMQAAEFSETPVFIRGHDRQSNTNRAGKMEPVSAKASIVEACDVHVLHGQCCEKQC